MRRAGGPTWLWECELLSLGLSAVRSLPSRSRAQQGSGLAVDPAGCELAALPSKLFTPTAANSHLTLGLLKPERSQSVQELSHMIMQLKKPGIQDGDKQGKCSLCKTGSRVDKIAACSYCIQLD